MSGASPRSRQAVCVLMATSATLSSGPSLALDKAACAAAAEAGQRLRNRGQLVAAREQLIVCASPECPQVVSQDCTGWLRGGPRGPAPAARRAPHAHRAPLHEV